MGHINLKKGYLTDTGKFPPLINSSNYLTHTYRGEGAFGSLYKIGVQLPVCVNVDSEFLADKTKTAQPAPKQQAPAQTTTKQQAPPQTTPKRQPPAQPAPKAQPKAQPHPHPTATQAKQKTLKPYAAMKGCASNFLFDARNFSADNLLSYYKDFNLLIKSEYGEIILFIDDVDKYHKADANYIGLKIDYNFNAIGNFGYSKTAHIKKEYKSHMDFIEEIVDMFKYGQLDSVHCSNFYNHICNLIDVICVAVPLFIK